MRSLTTQHWPDTLRVAVKASSYSEAVCVSYIPVVPITTTPLPPFFFRSQSCPCMSSSNTSDTIVVLMVPSMSATTQSPCSNAWVTHPATNRAPRCLTSQHWPDTLRVAVKASSYSEAVCVSYIPVVPITTTVDNLNIVIGVLGGYTISDAFLCIPVIYMSPDFHSTLTVRCEVALLIGTFLIPTLIALKMLLLNQASRLKYACFLSIRPFLSVRAPW